MTIEQILLAEHQMYNLLSIIKYDAYEVILSIVGIINMCVNEIIWYVESHD